MSSQRRIGIIWILSAALGYAFLPIFTRLIYANSSIQPTDIALWRFIFATPAIWLAILWRKNGKIEKVKNPESRKQIIRMICLGILYAANTLTAFIGLQYIPASLYTIILYTYPATVAIMSTLLGQRLPRIAWIALVFTFVGVFFTVPDLSLGGENMTLGILVAAGNAFFAALYFLMVSREMPKMQSVTLGTAYIITGTLIFLLMLIPFFGLQLPPNALTWFSLIGLAIISTAIPIFAINIGIQKIGVTQASIIATCEPIMTIIFAVILLGETILAIQWLGAALIITGVLLLELRPKTKSKVA